MKTQKVQREDSSPTIRVGIGGWSYEPWRETFYPEDLPKKSELQYASQHVTAIEINSTFYRLQTPSVFAKWRDDTPDDFVFSIKAPRHIVQRRLLAEAGESLERFLNSGLAELKQKLGPILWQLAPEKAFDARDLEAFLRFFPPALGDLPLRHALEVRHESFRCAEYLDLARRYRVTTVYAHSHEYPGIADVTGEFIYARLREAVASEPTGYSKDALLTWARRAKTWARGDASEDLPTISQTTTEPRDVFVYFINGAKERAPAAAMALLSLLT